ncbi:MAG: hypothetical protein KKB53_12660 [Acidobacteria bacterium]|nr:hypothetical protein [Acidobacteriota bacterium]
MHHKRYLLLFIAVLLLFRTGLPEIYYPWKDVYIGALENRGWAGLVLAASVDSIFAFRLQATKDGVTADGMDFLYLVSEVGPHSPDGKYARVKFDMSLPFKQGDDTPVLKKPSHGKDTLIIEWTRQDEKTVLGKIIVPSGISLSLLHYFPWDNRGRYSRTADNLIAGASEKNENSRYLFWTGSGISGQGEGEQEYAVDFPEGRRRNIYFAATLGSDLQVMDDHLYRYKNVRTIDGFLAEESTLYERTRVQINGNFKGVAEAITNNLFWMTLYQPGEHRTYIPAGRSWIFPRPDGKMDHWTIFEWDAFFNALEVSIESSKHAVDIVRAVLETQYSNGNIPNWRSRYNGTPDRSQPPIGSYVVLKLFQKSGDREFLEYAYPFLTKWHGFWKEKTSTGSLRRDGNGDGLLEWGSDRNLVSRRKYPEWEVNATGKQRAMWESGQDDLPSWSDAAFNEGAGTLAMNCVDLNCLYALDAYCLSQIAYFLDKRLDARRYNDEYEYMKKLINSTFWDERTGFYYDRHWNGTLSTRKAASNFYPLIAKIPTRERALRMVRRHLLNESYFWGDYVIPTISRDDPEFEQQQYWKGTVWPPVNYLVYQGLKAYGFDGIAYEFVKRSTSMFLNSWKNFQLCPENFDSRTGESGGSRHQSWGPLFALIALEEYIDFTPWEGFRFGMLSPEKKGSISRIAFQGRHYDLTVSGKGIQLKEEGREIITSSEPAVFRQFLYTDEEVSFDVTTLDRTKVTIRFETKGKYELLINSQTMEIFNGKSKTIRIPEGETNILIILLTRDI